MISLNFRDHDTQLVDTFASETLSPLFTSHNIDPNQIFPAPGQIASEWNADTLITGMQTLYEVITPREIMLPGTLVEKAELSLNDEEKAIIKTETVRHFTKNDASWVEFTAPVIQAAPADPVGYDDLAALIATLKRARNEALSLETVSL
jgi:hypothetical protein